MGGEWRGTVSKDRVVEGLGKSLGWSSSPSLCPTPSPSLLPPSLLPLSLPPSFLLSFPPSLPPGAQAIEVLHRQVLPFLLRRMKEDVLQEDVLQDLPPKIIQDYYCDLSPLQVSTTSLAVHFTKYRTCSNHFV